MIDPRNTTPAAAAADSAFDAARWLAGVQALGGIVDPRDGGITLWWPVRDMAIADQQAMAQLAQQVQTPGERELRIDQVLAATKPGRVQ